MTIREIIIGVVTAVSLSLIWWFVDFNATDPEVDAVRTEHEQDMKPLEDRARLGAQKEIRVLSEKITKTRVNPALSPEVRAELEDLYTGQLDVAQGVYDTYSDDDGG